jgi:hypothetical protein
MSLLFLEGFDKLSANTGAASESDAREYIRGLYPSDVADIQFYPGRLGGSALAFGDNFLADDYWFNAHFNGVGTLIVGFSYKPGRYDAQVFSDILQFLDTERSALQEQLTLSVDNSTDLSIYRGSTRIENKLHVLKMDRWHYIEMKYTVSNTGSYEVRVNGVNIMSDSGIDVKAGTNDNVSAVRFRGTQGESATSSGVALIDDIYICNTNGSFNNDFLGPIKVETLLPNASGDDSDFTPSAGSNFENVNDAEGNDGDTTYNESSTVANLDLFNCEDLTYLTSTIIGVRLDSVCRVTDTTARTIIPTLKSSTVEGAGSSHGIASIDWSRTVNFFEEDPNVSAAWTSTTINAMQIGYEVG